MVVSGVKRSGALIGVGALVGLLLIVYGVHRLTARPRIVAPVAVQAHVVTAAHAIARGARIEAADVSIGDQPGPAPLGALTAIGSAIGRTAAVDIPARQTITNAALVSNASLAAQVPIGYRAISIVTNDEIAVSDLLRPGDIVDVELVLGDAVLSKGSAGPSADRSEAGALLQGVGVVSVGDLVAPSDARRPADSRAQPRRTLTLAMTPEQIARFTLARSLGAFYLALRNPADHQGLPQAWARLPDIHGADGAVPAPRPAALRPVRRAPAEGDGVELVVGDQRQVIYPQ